MMYGLLLVLFGLGIGFSLRFFLKGKSKWQNIMVLLLSALWLFTLIYCSILILHRGGSIFSPQNRADVYFALSSLVFLISFALYYIRNHGNNEK